MFDPRSGELRYDRLPLQQYDLAQRWRALAEREDKLAELDRDRQRAERAVRMAEEAIRHATEQDAEAASAAILAGKPVGKPTHQAKAEAEHAEAVRMREAYTRAVQRAAEELYGYRAEHAAELYADFVAARRENAAQMARLAPELASRYAQDFALADVVRKLTPPEPAREDSDPPRNTTTVIAPVATLQTVAGVPRGSVEQVLSHLGGLVHEFEEPVEDAQHGVA